MKLRSLFATLLVGFLTLTSCSKEEKEEKKPSGVKQEKNLNARQDKWVYYSFEKNAIVAVADPQNSLDWDIAFFAYYAAITTLPTEYVQDVEGTMVYGNYPKLKEKKDTFSPFLSGGFDNEKGEETGYVLFNPNNIGKWPSVYAPTKFVYVIRTAKGAYVKFQVTDFYNDKAQANCPSFQYILSEDGKF